MTLQDLKTNRDLIISNITENFGSEFVKVGMNQMVKGLEYSNASCIEIFIYEFNESFTDFLHEYSNPKKSSKLAEMHSNAHQDEKYNSLTKNYDKY